jgi:spermidine synthase
MKRGVVDEMIRKLSLIAWCISIMLFGEVFAGSTTEKSLYQKNSLYQYIEVIEDTAKKERYIFNNRRDLIQGGMSLNSPDSLLFEYPRIAFVSLAFLDREPKSVLFVGLGAGSMPRYLSRYYPEADIDVVEIDPDMVDVAQKYFHFRTGGRIKVHTEDGRVFIKRSQKKYDIIFLDAYQSGDIPFHLTTAEFLREVKKKLNDNGVVAANILSQFKNKFFDSMIATYNQEFRHLYVLTGRKSNNFVFITTKNPTFRDKESVVNLAERIKSSRKFDYDLAELADRYEDYTSYSVNAKILTDDFAPVNLYQHMKSR